LAPADEPESIRPDWRGAFAADLQEAIARYIAAHNKASQPFVWTTSAKAIFDKLANVPVPSV
jgi:hypothetical protein